MSSSFPICTLFYTHTALSKLGCYCCSVEQFHVSICRSHVVTTGPSSRATSRQPSRQASRKNSQPGSRPRSATRTKTALVHPAPVEGVGQGMYVEKQVRQIGSLRELFK